MAVEKNTETVKDVQGKVEGLNKETEQTNASVEKLRQDTINADQVRQTATDRKLQELVKRQRALGQRHDPPPA